MNPNDPATAPGPRPTRLHYLPFGEVEAGMVLGEALTLTEHHIVRFSLPAGHVLSEANLRNLAVHHAEFVCIAQADTRSDEQIATDSAAAAARVMRIFDGADLSQPVMAALFDRVLAYRSK
jgi:hypothetical protein